MVGTREYGVLDEVDHVGLFGRPAAVMIDRKTAAAGEEQIRSPFRKIEHGTPLWTPRLGSRCYNDEVVWKNHAKSFLGLAF